MSGYQGDGGTPTPPACVDCRFYQRTDEYVAKHCAQPRCRTFDIINGYEPMSPERARQDVLGGYQVRGPCGPEGTLFEPVPPMTWLQRNAPWVIFWGGVIAFMLLTHLGGH